MHDREFVAPQARGEPETLRGLLETLSDADEHAVAEGVAHAVVEILEVVEVDEEHGDPGAALPCALERAVEEDEELAPVREQGERVVLRQMLQQARALLDLRLERAPVILGDLACGAQLKRHAVEGDGQGIELLQAPARRAHVLSARQLARRLDQPAHRDENAAHRPDRDREPDQEDRRGDPRDHLSLMAVRHGGGRGGGGGHGIDDGRGDRRRERGHARRRRGRGGALEHGEGVGYDLGHGGEKTVAPRREPGSLLAQSIAGLDSRGAERRQLCKVEVHLAHPVLTVRAREARRVGLERALQRVLAVGQRIERLRVGNARRGDVGETALQLIDARMQTQQRLPREHPSEQLERAVDRGGDALVHRIEAILV